VLLPREYEEVKLVAWYRYECVRRITKSLLSKVQDLYQNIDLQLGAIHLLVHTHTHIRL
jgi:hypothetical protein